VEELYVLDASAKSDRGADERKVVNSAVRSIGMTIS